MVTTFLGKLKRRVVTIDGYVDVPPNSEEQLLQAVASQPVSVGICGSERAFQLYSKGIFSGPCSTSLDHAVLIVGYGSENGVDYWIVKNSWGTGWGMKGYIHMVRNSGNAQGVCGINMLASYPTKTSPNPPPPPSPGPTRCSLLSYCSEGQTCCCTRPLWGFLCFSWKCCELDSAVCCNDHVSCCPHDYPVCDTQTKRCLKSSGNFTRVKVIEKASSFGKSGGWNSILEALNW
ncbi:probable cysteine protease RD21C [Macadamia integrifolia]|uniref:probable cysteine protease RD21C n=1 Tax=Macadamia integrifolia TaxID=60698 RepID=UPI001C4F6C3F|nr:probable cysteine protease RD21C [Macadamia integrifolia]